MTDEQLFSAAIPVHLQTDECWCC